jgi:hypothetical protein
MEQARLFGRPRLLLVCGSDNSSFIELMDECGAEIISASTANEALSKLHSEDFDAVLLYVFLGSGAAAEEDGEFLEIPFQRYFAGLRLMELIKQIGFKGRDSGELIPVVVMNTVPRREVVHFVDKHIGERDLHFFPPEDSMEIVSHLRRVL